MGKILAEYFGQQKMKQDAHNNTISESKSID